MTAIDYHAHVYYDEANLEKVKTILSKPPANINVGTIWEKLVGPHPKWSCQLSCDKQYLSILVQWCMKNRDEFHILIHRVTGNDLVDHTKHVMWIGEPLELNLEVFLD